MTFSQKRGFTLIELLVVISIIGLLSSVVLGALNGARAKADNTQRNQIAEEYRKALALAYDANGGIYPDTGNTTTTYCLGDYPTLGVYTDTGVCSYSWSFVSESPIINNALATYIKGLPVMKTATLSFGGATYKGPTYLCNSTPCKSVTVAWALQGTNQQCIRGSSSSNFFGVTFCSLFLN